MKVFFLSAILPDAPTINTECQREIPSAITNNSVTSRILVVGYATDTARDVTTNFHNAGHHVSFLPLQQISKPTFQHLQQEPQRNGEDNSKKHHSKNIGESINVDGTKPDEIHVLYEKLESPELQEPKALTAFMMDYVGLLQELSRDPSLTSLPVYVHLVGASGTGPKDGGGVGGCQTTLDYGDMQSLMYKQIDLYSTVYRHLYNQPIHLLQS